MDIVKTMGTRRKRATSETLPAPVAGYGLPRSGDPLWDLGHEIVRLVTDYLDDTHSTGVTR